MEYRNNIENSVNDLEDYTIDNIDSNEQAADNIIQLIDLIHYQIFIFDKSIKSIKSTDLIKKKRIERIIKKSDDIIEEIDTISTDYFVIKWKDSIDWKLVGLVNIIKKNYVLLIKELKTSN